MLLRKKKQRSFYCVWGERVCTEKLLRMVCSLACQSPQAELSWAGRQDAFVSHFWGQRFLRLREVINPSLYLLSQHNY